LPGLSFFPLLLLQVNRNFEKNANMDTESENKEQPENNQKEPEPPRNLGGRPKGSTLAAGAAPTVSKPESLQDLLWVREHWEEPARGKDHRSMLLARYKKDPRVFSADLQKAEAAFEELKTKRRAQADARLVKQRVSAEAGPDKGTELCRELARGLLKKLAEERAGR
jgi:hypothetical protein